MHCHIWCHSGLKTDHDSVSQAYRRILTVSVGFRHLSQNNCLTISLGDYVIAERARPVLPGSLCMTTYLPLKHFETERKRKKKRQQIFNMSSHSNQLPNKLPIADLQ